jgi:tetratricopeptide (TPR) repeat protein
VRKLLLPLLLLTTGVLLAQRARPAYDPETKDGLLIQHIQQETDATEKLHYMEQFATQFPSHGAAAWVYDQLQPAYYESKEWDQAIHIGALRLAIEPDNLEAAKIALRSADAKHDPEQMVKWADRVWQVATNLAAKNPANAADSKTAQTYAEFCLYSTAMASADLNTRLDMLHHLEQAMPSSQYAQGLTDEYFRIYRQLGDEEKSIEMAEKGLKAQSDNVDMLIYLAEIHFRKDTPHDRQLVLTFTAQAIDAIDKTPRPAALADADWDKKKAQTLGFANYMGGMSNSLGHNYAKADLMLRASLSYVKDNEAQNAAALYHLAMANYRLAEAGNDRTRPVDALRFMRRCATIKGPFQEQAVRNIEAIKSEYNLP